jgi:hypothetical protein
VSVAQAIVESLVVGVIEPLLLERPFEVPVDLGHEGEAGSVLAHSPCGVGPEGLRANIPRPFEHVGEHQHGHVAADAVALTGDFDQFRDHGVLGGWIAVIELQRVGPGREVRIPPVGEHTIAARSLDPRIVLRRASQVSFGALHVVLGVLFHPRMIQTGVVGHEIEEQPQAAHTEALAETAERRIAPELIVDGVAGNREPRARDVLLTKVGQRLLEFASPFRVGP